MDWISVDESSPLEGDIVPVVFKGHILYCHFIKKEGYLYVMPSSIFQEVMISGLPQIGYIIEPTHWMPLPSPPKDKS